MLQRMAHPHLWNDFVYKLTKQGRDFFTCCERVHAECRKVVTAVNTTDLEKHMKIAANFKKNVLFTIYNMKLHSLCYIFRC